MYHDHVIIEKYYFIYLYKMAAKILAKRHRTGFYFFFSRKPTVRRPLTRVTVF